MSNDRERVRSQRRRIVGAVAVSALLSLVVAPIAGADTKGELGDARAELDRLEQQMAGKEEELDRLSAQAAALGQRLDDAQARYEQITDELTQTRRDLDTARRQYGALRDDLNERAREAYMQGPASGLEVLLDAASFADLSDRLEFVGALSQGDADLATEVQNLKNELLANAQDQERLRAEQAVRLKELQDAKARLDAQFAEQQRIFDELQADRARAEELVKKLYKKVQQEQALAALPSPAGSVQVSADGIFRACPVDQPRAVYDGFGAPRYGGGYHPHAGNDIIAPAGTAIRAPFDGTARASSNGLGGLTVYVYGAQGWVYNAHLSAYSENSNGPVQAGDVIGYVGETGDTSTNHDHFEWHPNSIPADWPASPYGYSVIDTAVNPFPLLQQVC